MTRRYFILAGEQSGDAHAAPLMKALQKEASIEFFGVGGPCMREVGMELLYPMENFQLMGFWQIATAIPTIIKQYFSLRNAILKQNPDAVILVDYPGLNTRLATGLRRKGYQGKIIQYVSPSVWAWEAGLTKKMAHSYDHILCIFPFEPACYAHTNLPVTFVGHPTHEEMKQHPYNEKWQSHFDLDPARPLLSIFPGSRTSELREGFPIQLEAARRFLQTHPSYQLAISCAHPSLEKYLKNDLNAPIIPSQYTYDLMSRTQLALAASGTITVQLALHHTPSVVSYNVNTFNRWIIKYLIRPPLDFFCMVNIIGKKEIFPEFMEITPTPTRLFDALDNLERDKESYDKCLDACKEITSYLGSKPASKTAAQTVLKVVS